ncbi:hypothetical protein ACTMU2_18135 [Cupriavidus basilensis]
MDVQIKQHTAEDYIETQAALLAKHLSMVLDTLVSKEQVQTALYAAYLPEGQPAEDDSPVTITQAAFDAVALAIDAEALLRKARDRGASRESDHSILRSTVAA